MESTKNFKVRFFRTPVIATAPETLRDCAETLEVIDRGKAKNVEAIADAIDEALCTPTIDPGDEMTDATMRTPGPWEIQAHETADGKGAGLAIVARSGLIAFIPDETHPLTPSDREKAANAKLISNVPAMIERIERLENAIRTLVDAVSLVLSRKPSWTTRDGGADWPERCENLEEIAKQASELIDR